MNTAVIQKTLLDWFAKYQRDLPWRAHYSAYEVWISEIMLQQTQVKTVLPYFECWMKALPSIKDLACAKEERVLKLWEGLGYYSRARNLQKAARILTEKNDGQLYRDYDQLLSLPGIGPYTAGAIMSIAYNKPYPIVDGNVIRLLARLNGFEENVKEYKALFWQLSESLVPKENPRNFNQAMMEFGALMCTPKNPRCEECPLKAECRAYEKDLVQSIPNKGKSKKITPIQVSVGVIRKDGKVFIQKRLSDGLMGGLWEFPGGKVEKNESPQEALHREIQEELGIEIKNVKSIMRIKHAYTRFKVDLHCFVADYDRGHVQLTAAEAGEWASLEDLKQKPFPAANRSLIEKLEEMWYN